MCFEWTRSDLGYRLSEKKTHYIKQIIVLGLRKLKKYYLMYSSRRVAIEMNRQISDVPSQTAEISSSEQKQEEKSSFSKEKTFDYDNILECHLGQLGNYQLRSFLLLLLPAIFPGLITMSYTFTGAVPNYRYFD